MGLSKIGKLIVVIAWAVLIGGIIFGFFYSKGVLESGCEMCGILSVGYFLASVFALIAIWAVLMEIISISDRLIKIEKR